MLTGFWGAPVVVLKHSCEPGSYPFPIDLCCSLNVPFSPVYLGASFPYAPDSSNSKYTFPAGMENNFLSKVSYINMIILGKKKKKEQKEQKNPNRLKRKFLALFFFILNHCLSFSCEWPLKYFEPKLKWHQLIAYASFLKSKLLLTLLPHEILGNGSEVARIHITDSYHSVC